MCMYAEGGREGGRERDKHIHVHDSQEIRHLLADILGMVATLKRASGHDLSVRDMTHL